MTKRNLTGFGAPTKTSAQPRHIEPLGINQGISKNMAPMDDQKSSGKKTSTPKVSKKQSVKDKQTVTVKPSLPSDGEPPDRKPIRGINNVI